MKTVIDIVLLVIIALCTWSGYKRGVIGGLASLLAIVIAIFGGTMLSSAYAGEVIPALEPFVDGYIDSQKNRDAVLADMGYAMSDKSLNDILEADPSLRYDYAYLCLDKLGFHPERSVELAQKAVDYSNTNGADMTKSVVAVLCDTVTYVGALTIAFLLILIALVAIANVGNLSFRLPNLEIVDEIGGSVLGFIRGLVYCVLLCWVLTFFGIIIGKGTLNDTILGNFFLSFRFITKGLL